MTRKRRKDKLFTIKSEGAWIDRLYAAARVLDRPASQIAREAINEKLNELAQKHPEIDLPEFQQAHTEPETGATALT